MRKANKQLPSEDSSLKGDYYLLCGLYVDHM